MQPEATVFEFTSYVFEPDNKRILFNYKTEFAGKDPITFTETLLLPKIPNLQNLPPKLVNKLLESLHIILGISYYKFYCAAKISLPYALSKKESDFWNAIYKKGLGEFFYKNGLDPKNSPKFPWNKSVKTISYGLHKNEECLVGIGGGKDSIVSMELLKQHGFNATAFHIETGKPSEIINNVTRATGAKAIKIQRFLDSKVHDLHQYNGHIPISAIYAFLGVFTGILYDYSYVIVSNEYSSNFGNVTYKGLNINHQWSKSFEFETLFKDYVKNSITPDVAYFSLLRGFYEIRIVKLFSKYKEYFKLFSSCNRNFTLVRKSFGEGDRPWCGQCAKCIFAFTLLSAFLSKKELISIFGKNLYQQEDLLPLFKDVLGFGSVKPFDCVGTFQESQTALFLAKKKFASDFIMSRLFNNRRSSTKSGRQIGEKARYHKEVFQTNKENSVPEKFKFLGMENAYILGYGKEGKVTKQYLRKNYPKLKIGVGDEALDKKYLEKQVNFDIAVKTPGIKKEMVTIPYTTATNIFFSMVSGKNLIIAVTGSKGKSTTASLIYHILKTAGKKVSLLGNIGKPMLESLLKPVGKDHIFVLELSSYQLDDVTFSPDIAIVTNLFPEHLDYHGGPTHYYEAKKNIINFQNKNNYFVYDRENKKMAAWLEGYKGKAIPFSEKTVKSGLIGKHNEKNIKAAVAVAKILEIPEEKIEEGIKSFKALAHRLEFVGKFKGILFYDDGSSTNPESAILAIRALKNVDTIFLGGQDRGFDFSLLEKTIKKYRIRNVVLFPDNGKKMLASKKGFNILYTKSMREAVQFAYAHTKPESICLLSGGSPSYSLWKNFSEKGDQFKKFVKMLGKQ